jgi:hypothetical protein
MHYHYIEDNKGDLVDLVPFCSDSCHVAWCESNAETYGGWNGCQEGGDSVEFCANCGVVTGGTYECDEQRDNVVVNRVLSTDGEKCSHGHWIQLPSSYLE